eukprot:CAMPEP_0174738040 /NCGR_PEP_ID=MMETSP1094-20130205/69270_1 /TAXON_ID=156173 /ORGANISM="Chrysochromulina brevifilum, Strain UTEX LB 985" /LENGTH=104 /DNA_ID=CAMNT_0015941373 /DNA_START=302 /DNA_END=617 /DNA_ORIENTATION=-
MVAPLKVLKDARVAEVRVDEAGRVAGALAGNRKEARGERLVKSKGERAHIEQKCRELGCRRVTAYRDGVKSKAAHSRVHEEVMEPISALGGTRSQTGVLAGWQH